MLVRLLFGCADELQLSLEGCWYKQNWVSRAQGSEPPGAVPAKIHRYLSIPAPNPPLRLLFQARLKARRYHRLSRCLLRILGQQRRGLSGALHAGLCQSLTAAQLTLGLLEVVPDPETFKSLQICLGQASHELRQFYEARLCLFPEGQGSLFGSLGLSALPQDPLLFELLLASRMADPNLRASACEDELLLEFSQDDEADAVEDFLEALRARGDRIQRRGALIRVRFSA